MTRSCSAQRNDLHSLLHCTVAGAPHSTHCIACVAGSAAAAAAACAIMWSGSISVRCAFAAEPAASPSCVASASASAAAALLRLWRGRAAAAAGGVVAFALLSSCVSSCVCAVLLCRSAGLPPVLFLAVCMERAIATADKGKGSRSGCGRAVAAGNSGVGVGGECVSHGARGEKGDGRSDAQSGTGAWATQTQSLRGHTAASGHFNQRNQKGHS